MQLTCTIAVGPLEGALLCQLSDFAQNHTPCRSLSWGDAARLQAALCVCEPVSVAQSCLTLFDPVDWSQTPFFIEFSRQEY